MGATKSKVDCPPEEETESPSQTSESTSRRSSSRHPHGHRSKDRDGRRWQHSDKANGSTTPSLDEAVLKPFTYRTRKQRLIDSLQAGGDKKNQSDSENDDSADPRPPSDTKLKNEKLSVAKIVESLQANLIAKNGSHASIMKGDHVQRGRRSKTPIIPKTTSGQTASNSLLDIPDRKKRASSRKSKSQVEPTGVEEKIIETLIHPKKKRGNLPQVEQRDSYDSMDIHSKHATVSYDDPSKGKVKSWKQNIPPPPPPIDFSGSSASETESGARSSRCSSNYREVQRQDSNKDSEEKPTDSALPRRLPSHLNELKLRFSNDIPRSPYDDNLHDGNKVPDKNTKQSALPSRGDMSRSVKFNFTNDIPIGDSLHILSTDKNGVKTAKTAGKRESKDPGKMSKNQLDEYVEKEVITTSKANEKNKNMKKEGIYDRKVQKDGNKHHKTSTKKSAVLANDDDVINCFTAKTEYDQAKVKVERDEHKHKGRKTREEDRKETRRPHKSANKSARTQTSNSGLIDSSVQTYPDIAYQHPDYNRKDTEIQYESTIDNKAKEILRKFSVERQGKNSPPSEQGEKIHERRKNRNGSTQWKYVDLLVNSSCEKVISKGKENDRKSVDPSKKERRASGKASRRSKSEARAKNEQDCCKGNANMSNYDRKTEICCMHLQVVPSESDERKSTTKHSVKKDIDLLDNKERRKRTPRSCRESDQSLCKQCSQMRFLSSSDGMSTAMNYATSSCRSRDLSLLSSFGSRTTVASRAPTEQEPTSRTNNCTKDKDLYRQMEELGLGFLRNGEWVPTDVISRTLWKNLEKCTENCQATWRRRSRSFTHTKTLKNTG